MHTTLCLRGEGGGYGQVLVCEAPRRGWLCHLPIAGADKLLAVVAAPSLCPGAKTCCRLARSVGLWCKAATP
jgi:hypothetical protein